MDTDVTLAQDLFFELSEILSEMTSHDLLFSEAYLGDNEEINGSDINNINHDVDNNNMNEDAMIDVVSVPNHVSTQTTNGFWCHLCPNRTYAAQASLKRHMDTVHSQVRFACLQCKGTYSRRSDLKKHLKRMHRRENNE